MECNYSPQRQNNLIFFWLPYTVALARLLLQSTPGEQCSEMLLRSSPTLQTLPLPRPLAFVRFDPPACQAGLTSAGLEAAGPDGCLLGRIHFPCGYVMYVLLCWLRCFSCSHTVLPKEHSLGVIFFSPHFPHVYAVFFFNSTCISLLIILCMIVYVTNNKEPLFFILNLFTHLRRRWFRPALQSTHESQSRPSAHKSQSRPSAHEGQSRPSAHSL